MGIQKLWDHVFEFSVSPELLSLISSREEPIELPKPVLLTRQKVWRCQLDLLRMIYVSALMFFVVFMPPSQKEITFNISIPKSLSLKLSNDTHLCFNITFEFFLLSMEHRTLLPNSFLLNAPRHASFVSSKVSDSPKTLKAECEPQTMKKRNR